MIKCFLKYLAVFVSISLLTIFITLNSNGGGDIVYIIVHSALTIVMLIVALIVNRKNYKMMGAAISGIIFGILFSVVVFMQINNLKEKEEESVPVVTM